MKTKLTLTLSLVLAALVPAYAADSVFNGFVTAKGDQLMDGDQPFRFVSFNIPNLHLVEDNVAFKVTNPWRLPNRFEITDALESVSQMGGTVVRSYVISVVRTNDLATYPRHVLAPGEFNAQAFESLDEVLMIANQTGVRVILPLVDNWSWWGGRAEYASFRKKSKDDFWTDPQIISDFKQTIRYVLTRTNSLTGVVYRDDKAILGWETGNELDSTLDWTRQIGAYIKSLDTNHLVIDGFTKNVRDEVLKMPEIDMVTTHHYPGDKKSYKELVTENWEKAKGKKPYFVGEFGFAPLAEMQSVFDYVRESGISGALVWSLRPHNRDGGFYWHSEPAGGNKYKAYHWPGFPSGNEYEETLLLNTMRNAAFAIRGVAVPKASVPKSPILLPIQTVGAISWQGSAGASSYVVERARSKTGPWVVVGDKVDDAVTAYRPLFSDSKAGMGEWFYRVSARNESGVSEPSNVSGPVSVRYQTLVDELTDFSKVASRDGAFEIKTHDCRQAKEDTARAAGTVGSTVVYHVNGSIKGVRVYALFPKDVSDLSLMISKDGKFYKPLAPLKEEYFGDAGDYGYFKPVLYRTSPANVPGNFLRVELTGDTEIGRIEIDYQ